MLEDSKTENAPPVRVQPVVSRPDWELRLRHAIAHPKMPKQIGEDLIGCLSEIDRLRSDRDKVITLLTKANETGWMKYSVEALAVCQSANAGTQRPGTRDATIANPDALPGSLHPVVGASGPKI